MIAKFLIVIAGFIAGGAIVIGTALALDQSKAPTKFATVAPMTMSGMMGATQSSAATTKLTIQHVQKGCHVWSDGSRQAAAMRLNLRRGAHLQILNQDVDAHRLVQLARPTLSIHGYMMMGRQQLLTFKQPGLYRFKTKVVETGQMMDVKTIGPDNTLRLTVSVREPA